MRGWMQGMIALAMLAAGAGGYWYWTGGAPKTGGGSSGTAVPQSNSGANGATAIAVEAAKVTIGAVARRIEALG
jgi:hypothetical protein